MCITEFNEKTFVEGIRAEGVAKGRAEEIFSSVQEGDYSVERGAEKLNISVEEFMRRMEEAGYTVPSMV